MTTFSAPEWYKWRRPGSSTLVEEIDTEVAGGNAFESLAWS